MNTVPSRWSHRRRTLGALETVILSPARGLLLTPMGNGVGTGAIHMVDQRAGLQTALVATGNPAAYDLAYSSALKFVFCASDNGAGGTVLHGFSYANPGVLTPLVPASLTLSGLPAAYVNRIGVNAAGNQLHVPTATGIHVVGLSGTAPNMVAGTFISTGSAAPTTNPILFDRNGQATWIIGTSTFDTFHVPVEGGYIAWTATGAGPSGTYGLVYTDPNKSWVPAAGAEELAVVGNGTDTYVYYLLREPLPGTFYVKASAIGVVRFLGSAAPTISTLAMPDNIGEPFSIPAVSGTRVAFESSFGPPFIFEPPDGGEKIGIIYTPLDPLGASTEYGLVGNPNPLGGRISTKGMDRPIWSRDGTRVMASTSHFPGAPNPGIPGLEVLEVPLDKVVDEFVGPHTVVDNLPFPKQSIIFPSAFLPVDPSKAHALDGLSFFGNVFNQGLASLIAPANGEVAQLQPDADGFTLHPGIPNFRSILPPTFNDVAGSLIAVPGNFGARRTAFNFAFAEGFPSLTMTASIDNGIYVQKTAVNLQALMGVGADQGVVRNLLPTRWITTTEILSL